MPGRRERERERDEKRERERERLLVALDNCGTHGGRNSVQADRDTERSKLLQPKLTAKPPTLSITTWANGQPALNK